MNGLIIIFCFGGILSAFSAAEIDPKEDGNAQVDFQEGSDFLRKKCIKNFSDKKCKKDSKCCSKNCVNGICTPAEDVDTSGMCLPGNQCGGFVGIPCCGNLWCQYQNPQCADCFGICTDAKP